MINFTNSTFKNVFRRERCLKLTKFQRFAWRLGFSPYWGGEKGDFRDWTILRGDLHIYLEVVFSCVYALSSRLFSGLVGPPACFACFLSFSVLFSLYFFSLKSEGSIACKDGTIQQGDKLLEVNGISLKKATQEEACKVLRVS